MAILLTERTRVIVQGITGRIGRFHTEEMMAYGTRVVGGVTPGKGGGTLSVAGRSSTPSKTRSRPLERTPPSCSCRHRSPPTPSWRPPTPGSVTASASPTASRHKT